MWIIVNTVPQLLVSVMTPTDQMEWGSFSVFICCCIFFLSLFVWICIHSVTCRMESCCWHLGPFISRPNTWKLHLAVLRPNVLSLPLSLSRSLSELKKHDMFCLWTYTFMYGSLNMKIIRKPHFLLKIFVYSFNTLPSIGWKWLHFSLQSLEMQSLHDVSSLSILRFTCWSLGNGVIVRCVSDC